MSVSRSSSPWLLAWALAASVPGQIVGEGAEGAADPAHARTHAPANDDARADESPGDGARARPAERLLTLANGLVLRGEARLRAGRWELRRDGVWTALPDGLVTADRPLAPALSAFRARRSALREAPVGEAAALASEGLRDGLYAEALQLLDEILADDPDAPAVHALLARDDLPVAVPAYEPLEPDVSRACGPLLEYGGRSPRALQELVVRQLRRVPDGDLAILRDLVLADLLHESSGRRAFAALVLRRLFPGEGLAKLVRRSVLDPVQDVRVNASHALRAGGAPQDEVLVPLVAALASDASIVRTHAAESLGIVGSPAAVAPLMSVLSSVARAASSTHWAGPRAFVFAGRQVSYVQDFDPEVAQNAVIADPRIGVVQEGAVLDARVLGANDGGSRGHETAREGAAIRASLKRITGLDLRDSNAAWLNWWKENGETRP